MARMPLRGLGLGAAALALAVSGLFGGLDEVDRHDLPAAALNAVDYGEPWTVRVTGAGVAAFVPSLRPQQDGDRWLVVRAVVEVTADESRTDAGEEHSKGSQVPKRLEIAIIGKTLRQDSFTGSRQWLDAQPRALVRAPVKELKT